MGVGWLAVTPGCRRLVPPLKLETAGPSATNFYINDKTYHFRGLIFSQLLQKHNHRYTQNISFTCITIILLLCKVYRNENYSSTSMPSSALALMATKRWTHVRALFALKSVKQSPATYELLNVVSTQFRTLKFSFLRFVSVELPRVISKPQLAERSYDYIELGSAIGSHGSVMECVCVSRLVPCERRSTSFLECLCQAPLWSAFRLLFSELGTYSGVFIKHEDSRPTQQHPGRNQI